MSLAYRAIVTSINDELADDITDLPSLYPNPVSEELYLSQVSTTDQITVISTSGQVVNAPVNFEKGGAVIMVNGLPSGMYFVRIIKPNQNQNLRFIKK